MCDAHVVVHNEPLRVVVHFVGLQSDTGHELKCLVEFEFPLSSSLDSFSNLTHFACGEVAWRQNSENQGGRGEGGGEVRKGKREGKNNLVCISKATLN